MLELRKEYFADERDDNLNEIGKGTQRQDMLGHVTGASTYFNDHQIQGMLHLKVLRSAHSHARIRRIDLSEAERSPGVRRIIRGQDVPHNLNTLLSLINFGLDDEPGGWQGPSCRACRQPILPDQRQTRVEFSTDRDGFKRLTGDHHIVSSKPFASTARVINIRPMGR